MIIFRTLLILCSIPTLVSGCKKSEGEEQPLLPTLTLSAQNPSLQEGNSGFDTLRIEVGISGALTGAASVSYRTLDGSAMTQLDFQPLEGTLTFSTDGETQTLNLLVIGDTIREGDEFLFFELFDPLNAELGTPRLQLRIRDNTDAYIPFGPDGYRTPTAYPGWTLAWQDEFEGNELDPQSWTYEMGNGCPDICGWGNDELEWYTDRPQNARLENGHLIIEARNDNWQGHPYTSARIKTQGKREFQYGRIDIRARLPQGRGIWPALWMLGSNIGQVGWPACGEIDIMELVGHLPHLSHGTAHWGRDVANHHFLGADYSHNGEPFSERFHVFSIIWLKDHITWFVDDVAFFEFDHTKTQGQPYPFNQPFFFIFNLAVGGNWPGPPDSTTVFPQQMVVDYVRVFQKN